MIYQQLSTWCAKVIQFLNSSSNRSDECFLSLLSPSLFLLCYNWSNILYVWQIFSCTMFLPREFYFSWHLKFGFLFIYIIVIHFLMKNEVVVKPFIFCKTNTKCSYFYITHHPRFYLLESTFLVSCRAITHSCSYYHINKSPHFF